MRYYVTKGNVRISKYYPTYIQAKIHLFEAKLVYSCRYGNFTARDIKIKKVGK